MTKKTEHDKPHKTAASPPDPELDIFSMPLDDLKRNVAQALVYFEKIDDLLPGLVLMTSDGRTHTNGRYRDGEAEALQPLTALAAKKPALFESLANKDEGNDPLRFEPELIEDRLERVIILSPVAQASESLNQGIGDSQLHLGEQTRPVLLNMYNLAKAPAKLDPVTMTFVSQASSFFARIAKLAAVTRRNRKTAAQATPPDPSTK